MSEEPRRTRMALRVARGVARRAKGLLERLIVDPLATRRPRGGYRHELGVCAIFQNDARFLGEWIEFHRLMGATRFFLYDNLSTDDFRDVLAPYITAGEVELYAWPRQSASLEAFIGVVVDAYEHALGRARKERVKWLACIDSDEFLFPSTAADLPSVLADFEDVGAVVSHWQLFGDSGVEQIPPQRLMIETLSRKAPAEHRDHKYVKSIVRPERVRRCLSPHHSHYRTPYGAVDERFQPVSGSVNADLVFDRLRINHYWSRDHRFFVEEKLGRRMRLFAYEGVEGQLQRLREINVVEDHIIDRFVPELRRRMKLE